MPRPMVTLLESTTRMGTWPSRLRAPIWAAWPVAESLEDRLMQTMPSAPRSVARRNAVSKAPGEGAAVSGRTGEEWQRAQNSLGERSRRSTSSSPPKRMVYGTTSMSSSVTRSFGRSQLLSVTIRTSPIRRPPSVSRSARRRGRADPHFVPVAGLAELVQHIGLCPLEERDMYPTLLVDREPLQAGVGVLGVLG